MTRRLLLLGLGLLLVLGGCGTTTPVQKSRPTAQKRIAKQATWYRVKKGDSLYTIAWRAGKDWRNLARWNGLKPPYTIYPGQRLRLKPPPSKARRANRGTTKGAPPKQRAHKPQRSPRTAKARKPTAAAGRLRWRWPTRGRIVTRFSTRDGAPKGIRIAGNKGQKVLAAEGGTVVYSGSGLIGYGQLIIIKHNNEFLSAYGLNSRLYVKEGQKVERGQHIADMGTDNSGRAVLHFEIRRDGNAVDPLRYLPKG